MRNALQQTQTIVVLGGASEIGQAIAAELTGPATSAIVLGVRDPATVEAGVLGGDGVALIPLAFDAADTDSHVGFVARVVESLGGRDIDVVVVAFGVLGSQATFDSDPQAAAAAVHVNYTGAVSAMLAFAQQLRRQAHGHFVVVSSVAGERVRSANYVYGSSKAGLDAFAQGFGDALAGTGVSVTVVRPGFVHSKMTAGLAAAPFASTPAAVAEATAKAVRSRRHTVWAPGVLRLVFMVLRHLPRAVFRRLPLG